MAKIDYYAKSLIRFQAREMILQSNANVQLRFATGDRFANQQLTHANLVEIVEEIAPAQAMAEVSSGGRAMFRYTSEHGELVVSVEPSGRDAWRVSIAPAPDEGVQINLEPEVTAAPPPPAATQSLGAAALGRIQPVAIPASQAKRGQVEPPPREVSAATLPQGLGDFVGARPPAPAPAPAPAADALPQPHFLTAMMEAADEAMLSTNGAEVAATMAAGAVSQAVPPTLPAAEAARSDLPSPASIAGGTVPVRSGVMQAMPVEPTAHGAPRVVLPLGALLQRALDACASDLHLQTGHAPLIRAGGGLRVLEEPGAIDETGFVESLLEHAPPERRAAYSQRGEVTFGASLVLPSGESLRLRVTMFRERAGAAAALRLLGTELPSPGELGLPRVVVDLSTQRSGLILVCGPAGSGKTTTLGALVDFVNRKRTAHLVTIEDPIEILHESQGCLVHQREVGVHAESFSSAVRTALRADPEVLVLGDLPDSETAGLALEAAVRGCLVLATTTAPSVPAAVERFVSLLPAERQGTARIQLADVLRGVVSQRLCQRTGGGRVGSFEVLIGGNAAANVIREGKPFQLVSLMQAGRGHGMSTLEDSLLQLVRSGTIEAGEAELWAAHPTEMRRILAAAETQPPVG